MSLRILFLSIALCFSSVSYSAESYLTGNVVNITAVEQGMLIMLDTGVPTHCEGTPYNWMLIKQEHTVMISVTLAMWMSGRKTFTVYTKGRPSSFCEVGQIDPAE
jgi:hypothetical protein